MHGKQLLAFLNILFMADFYGLPTEIIGTASGSSGSAKRRRKNALPRTFLIVDVERRQIRGAFILVDCVYNGDSLLWRCDLAVFLESSILLDQRELKSANAVKLAKFAHARELEARQGQTTVGGMLNDHFSSCAAERWSGWPADADLLRACGRSCSRPFTFRTEFAYSSAVGIVPSDTVQQPCVDAREHFEAERLPMTSSISV